MRLFAALREQAGTGRVELELPADAHVSDIWNALALGGEEPSVARLRGQPRVRLARPCARRGRRGRPDPPVSGGDDALAHPLAELTYEPIDLGLLIARVADPGAGAIATFLGTVRNHARGRNVLWLDYEAFDEMAVLELERVAPATWSPSTAACAPRSPIAPGGSRSARRRWRSPCRAAHRAAALAACQQAIDTLKQTVPIWKKERYADGEEWVSQGS